MLPIKRILCPTDFSGPASSCVEASAELAQHFGAELLLLHVIPVVPSLPPDPSFVFKVPEFELRLHADADKRLREMRDELAARNVKVRTLVGHGPAAEKILAAARQEGVDLIVIATHGSTGLGHLVFGSVAERVVRHSECPVLTVRMARKTA